MKMEIDQASLNGFLNVIKDTIIMTRRESSQVLTQAFIKFVQSGRSGTKNSRRFRQVLRTDKSKKKSRDAKYQYRITVLRQNKPTRYIYTNDKQDKRRIIANRGLAKLSWSWMLKKFGKSITMPKPVGYNPSNLVSIHSNLDKGADIQKIDYSNRLSYLLKNNPTIHSTALKKAEKSMRYMLDNNIKRKQERLWKKGIQ